VDVLRLRHYVPSKPGRAIHRLAMEGSFCLLALPFVLGWLREKWDVVFYVGAQPSIALLARFAGALYSVPYVLNINDLASEAAENVGILRNRGLVRFFTKLEHFAYGGAAGAMVLADSFTEALARNGYPRERVRLIRSPIDLQEFRPVSRDPSARRSKRLPDGAFVLLYAGSMGLKQDLRTVVAAAKLLRDSHPRLSGFWWGRVSKKRPWKRRLWKRTFRR
jgi:colanic acid biosynthesis glycosyl transferase WcaI